MECLNKYFKVVTYNGGVINGPAGIQTLFAPPSSKPVNPLSSRSGQIFDIVLEYNNPDITDASENVFTLDYVIATHLSEEVATAPLKSAIVFVSDTSDISYTSAFDKVTADTYTKDVSSKIPSGFIVSNGVHDTVCSVLPQYSTGKYLHIKLLGSWGEDNNIDLGAFVILGKNGRVDKTGSSVDTEDTTVVYREVSKEQLDTLRTLGYLRYSIVSGEVSPLHPDVSDVLHTDPCLVFITPMNIAALLAKSSTDRTKEEQDVVAAYEVFAKNSKHCLDNDVHYLSLDSTTKASIANLVLPFLGEMDGLEARVVRSTDASGPYDLPVGVPLRFSELELGMDSSVTEESQSSGATTTEDASIGTFALKSNKPYVVVGITNVGMSLKYFSYEQDYTKLVQALDVHVTTDVFTPEQLTFLAYDTCKTCPLSLFVRVFCIVAEERTRLHLLEEFGNIDDEEELELLKQIKNMGLYDKKKHVKDTTATDASNTNSNLVLHLLQPRALSLDLTAPYTHPVYTNAVILTNKNFQEVVVDSTKNVLLVVIDPSMKNTINVAQKLLLLSTLLKKYKMDLTIGIFDCSHNDFPYDHYNTEIYENILLYTKKAPVVAKKSKSPAAKPFCYDSMNKPVYRYMMNFEGDIGEEEAELLQEIGDDDLVPLPSLQDIIEFVRSHIPTVLPYKPGTPDYKKCMTEFTTLNDALENLSYLYAGITTILPTLGVRMKSRYSAQGYILLDTSSIAYNNIQKLKSIAADVYSVVQDMVYPFGEIPIGFNTTTLPDSFTQRTCVNTCNLVSAAHTNYLDVSDIIVFLKEQRNVLDTCIETINPATEGITFIRNTVKNIAGLLHAYPALCIDWITGKASTASAFTNFVNYFTDGVVNTGSDPKLIMDLPKEILDALTSTNQSFDMDAIAKRMVVPGSTTTATTPQEPIVYNPSDMEIVKNKLLELNETMEQYILDHVMKQDSQVYGNNVPVLTTEEQLERFLSGYEVLQAPPRGKATIQSKKKVADATERLICLYVTSLVDGSHAENTKIATTMKDISNMYAIKQLEDKNVKNVVFARVYVEQFPSIIDILNIDKYPSFVFIQNNGEAIDLRASGIPVPEISKYLYESLDSMQLLDR